MEQERKKYRLVRLLTGGVTPLVLAAALLVFARTCGGVWEPGAQVAGICRELILGTTEGRQALFGSCWVAPLPVLFYLPFAWLLPEPLAGWTAFFAAWLFLFWAVREAVKASGHSGWRIVFAQVSIAAMMAVSGQPQVLQVSTALTAGLLLMAAASLADWAAYRRLRDVVVAGAAGALLALCGFPVFGPAGLGVGLVPLVACGHRETRSRLQAWVLLGWLPLFYALGVWLLMNRLVLGDPLYFLRSLGHLVPRPLLFLLSLFATALIFVPSLIVTWLRDARAQKPGAGPVAASALLISFAVALIACGQVLDLFGLGWNTLALYVCALVVLLVAMTRLQQPLYRLALSLGLFVWASTFWFKSVAREAAVPADRGGEICREVEAYVNARTPYGRVFVLGYAGLDLLRSYAGERLMPNMDLHVGGLRRAYKGQNLYVLVPEPTGSVRAESIFWKNPDIYTLGGDRLLVAATFGTWRLFEVVTAPTQEQLDEWKRKR
jgi:hypothetical protein